ncbi:MAG: hypothetical protein ACRDO7_00595 [Nocardioidaceae bacterium]
MRINEKALGRIEQELAQDGVWVSPSLRSTFPTRAERRIEKAVEQANAKVYVALVEIPSRHPQFHGRVKDLFATIRTDTGSDGTYVGVEGARLEPATYSFGGREDALLAGQAATLRHPRQPIEQVIASVEFVGNGKAEQVYDRLRKEDRPSREQQDGKPHGRDGSVEEAGPGPTTADHSDTVPVPSAGPAPDDGSGMAIGIGIGVAVALVLLAAAIGLALRRRSRTGRGFRLPPVKRPSMARLSAIVPTALLSTIRTAGSDRHEKRARRDVIALGERIEAVDLDASGDAWEQALDHYDAARRILGGKHEPADTVGAIVLAARGDAALDAAADGRDWKPERPCYLNPLHGMSERSVTWRGASGGVDLPACSKCAGAIAAGRMPDDVLDFMHEGRPRHYFALDLAPWSRTGYGALEPDLLARLERTRLRIR